MNESADSVTRVVRLSAPEKVLAEFYDVIPDDYRQAMQGILSMNNTMGVHGKNEKILFISNGFEEILLFDILEDGQLKKNEERMTLNHLK